MRRAFRAADAVVANSAEMARFASLYYDSPSRRSHVVYNGVDLSRFEPARGSGGLEVGTIGRIEQQKNLDGFIEAAAAVYSRRPDARFRVAGTGSELARLESAVAARGLSGVVSFEGTTNDAAGFLAELDQFWLTSNWEGTPNVVLEAMASAVPVIATRVGGTPEIVADGRTGVLVDKGDMNAVAEASLRLAADSALSSRLALAARADAQQRFSLAAMVAATTGVYDSVLGSGNG
jgi:glycosyltransferase involved in cell wall biosynthesis